MPAPAAPPRAIASTAIATDSSGDRGYGGFARARRYGLTAPRLAPLRPGRPAAFRHVERREDAERLDHVHQRSRRFSRPGSASDR